MVVLRLTPILAQLVIIGCIKTVLSQSCDRSQYTVLEEPGRSTMSVYDASVDTPLCDEDIDEDEWFRFESGAGNRIPERQASDFVPTNRCGTQAPIYIRGLNSHPSSDDTTVSATVCANYASNTCQWSETIQIHKCPATGPKEKEGYFLYKLKSPPGCDISYCAGEGVPCNRGDYWNGFECVNYFPPMTGRPIFAGFHTNGSGYATEVYFTCRVQYTRRVNDTNARFRVTFLFDGTELEKANITKPTPVLEPVILTADSSLTVALGEYYLKGRLGKQISCKVASYWLEYEPTSNSTLFSLESRKLAFLSEASSYSFTHSSGRQGSTFTINFRSTIPLTCSHCASLPTSQRANCCRYIFKVQSSAATSCSVRWSGIQSHTATTGVNFVPGQLASREHYKMEFLPYNSDEIWNAVSLWRDYAPEPTTFEVIPSSGGGNLKGCYSVTDPSITTFDNYYYYSSGLGVFYLVKSENANQQMEVQVRQEMCPWGTCNCGVIIREGNSVYKISMCENGPSGTYRTPTVVRLLSQVPIDSSGITTSSAGNYFGVRMPSGLRVDIYASNFLQIYVYLPPEYHGRTSSSSICGNSNGASRDDYIADMSSIRVPDGVNYFKSQPICSDTSNPEAKSCDCGSGKRLKCSNTDATQSRNSRRRRSLPDRWTSGRVCNKGRRRRSLTSDEETDFFLDPEILFPPYSYDPNYGVNVSYSWPTPKGKTEAKVEQYCNEMFSSVPTFSDCKEVINITSLVDMCIHDIKGADEWFPATPYIEVMGETCINALIALVNDTEDENNPTNSLLTAISDQICPSQCNNRGNCIEGNCICNQGFIGPDCGFKEGVPPNLTGIFLGGICDARVRPCEVISVLGRGFVSSSSLSCRFHIKEGDRYVETNGTLITGGEISCPVPTTTSHRRKKRSADTKITALSTLDVALSTDGANYSNTIAFSIYDSQCMECKTAGSCKQKNGSCLIENECFACDAVSAQDICLKCDPSISNNSFVNITTLESWQQCSRQCDYGSQARNIVCGATVIGSERRLCKSSDCAENLREAAEGVILGLSQENLAKILMAPSIILKDFADTLNDYCAGNGDVCCNVTGKAFANMASVNFTSPSLLSFAPGFPILTPNEARVKIIVKIDLSLVKSQCTGTPVQSTQLVYADESVIFDIVSTEKDKLEQKLGVILKSILRPIKPTSFTPREMTSASEAMTSTSELVTSTSKVKTSQPKKNYTPAIEYFSLSTTKYKLSSSTAMTKAQKARPSFFRSTSSSSVLKNSRFLISVLIWVSQIIICQTLIKVDFSFI